MRAEIRSRQLTGRHQISDGGQHLVDGVPFGRPYLREPNRPAVRIPPRKRARLEEITNEAAELLSRAQQLSKAQQDALVAVTQAPASNGAGKSVHFAQAEDAMELDEGSDSEDEDDDDFASGDDVEIDEDVDSGSDTGSSSASDASDSEPDSNPSSDDSSSDSDGGSDSESDSDSDAAPEVRSSKTPVPKPVVPPQPPTNEKTSPPGEGKKTTHSRNARRMRTNRLKHLKEAGKLHKDADLKALDEYEERQTLQQSESLSQRQGFAKSAGKRKRLDDEEAPQPVLDESAELAKRKQEMIARFGQDSDVTLEAEEPSSNKVEDPAPVTSSQHSEESNDTPEKTPERKRLRPDVSAIGRMLARQTKNLVKKSAKTTEKEPTPEPEGSTDPDFWKSRINLSAFECWEEEYELTAPPFPFVQHWDPAGKVMRDAAKKKKAKKGGKKAPRPVEEYEEEEEEEEKIFLNYDDAPDFNPDVEIHAAIEDQLQQDIATAAQEQDEFPPLPEDLNALPDLTPADIKVGAVIVCKFFGINPVTVTPETSDFKTSIVEQEGDSGAGAGTFRLRIAQRDLPKKEKKFNSKGQRVYDAKDGFFMEEDDEEGLWSGMFGELVQGKLLKAA